MKECRRLTEQETGWISTCCDAIRDHNMSISGLAQVLVVLAEMANDNSVDEHYRKELCGRGIMSIAYGIESISSAITDRTEDMERTINGLTMAEMQGRLAHPINPLMAG